MEIISFQNQSVSKDFLTENLNKSSFQYPSLNTAMIPSSHSYLAFMQQKKKLQFKKAWTSKAFEEY